MTAALELRDATKDFPVRRPMAAVLSSPWARVTRRALDGVSLAVAPGEVVVLLGPNGSGKTTCLSLLAGLLRATAGTASVCGIDAELDPLGARARLGHADGEVRGFYGRLSVDENLRFYAALHGLPGAALEPRIREVARQLEFGDRLREPLQTLSTGLVARVALARAVMHEPRALLLDEITRSLDPGAAERTRAGILALARERGTAVLWTTHDLAEAERIAGRVVVLVEGRVAASGAFAEVRAALDRVFSLGARA
jgi:ABC-2 type transport system ATP-binding protein